MSYNIQKYVLKLLPNRLTNVRKQFFAHLNFCALQILHDFAYFNICDVQLPNTDLHAKWAFSFHTCCLLRIVERIQLFLPSPQGQPCSDSYNGSPETSVLHSSFKFLCCQACILGQYSTNTTLVWCLQKMSFWFELVGNFVKFAEILHTNKHTKACIFSGEYFKLCYWRQCF